MALKELEFSGESWPAEGRTLCEIIERLLEPPLLARLLHQVGDRGLPGYQGPRHSVVFKVAQVAGKDPVSDALLGFVTEWNAGAYVAKARAGSPFEPLTELPPPAAGYVLTIDSLLHSRIVDARTMFATPSSQPFRPLSVVANTANEFNRARQQWFSESRPVDPSVLKKFYDVRFWPTSKTDTVGMTLKELLHEIVEKIPFPSLEDRRHGWKIKWAERATAAINKRPHQNTSKDSVRARMNEYRLWPPE